MFILARQHHTLVVLVTNFVCIQLEQILPAISYTFMDICKTLTDQNDDDDGKYQQYLGDEVTTRDS